jgi:serine/threonine protein kinase
MGIIHGDVKLANIGLHKESEDSEGVIKVFDFGLSLVSDSSLSGKAHMNKSVGTFGYMAPELKGVSKLIQSTETYTFSIE